MDEMKTNDAVIHSITNAYTCLLNGSPPSQSAGDLATDICAVLCRNAPLLCALSHNSGGFHVNMSDLTCLTLTVVDNMYTQLLSHTMRPQTTLYCLHINTVFQEAHVMSTLVHLFQADDQVTSHLAAKCVSTYVYYELRTSGEINQIWQHTCAQAFQSARTCKALDPCIYSFISVFKRLLKDSHESKTVPETLQKLLVAFDAHLTLLVFTFLPGENMDEGPSGVCDTHRGDRGVTLSSLLTLLEVLCASRLRCSTGVCAHSQRLVYTRARGLIKMAASSSCDYYVKRQVLLLMKRTLLQKAGEDMALGETSATAPGDEHFAADMEALADTTLRAMSADWLRFVPVEMTTASSFGGSSPGEGQALRPDHVMLRAVGLVVLKSLELAPQTGAGADGAVGACLGALLGFLRDRGVPLTEPSHRCGWVTLVFAEQDDDMMEAAKTLLTLYLRNDSRCAGSDPEAASGTSGTPCASGFNPHCHFLLFLRSVSFDHSTLLDFLISSETCFLEYLVRYLKHLRADSPGFSLACRKMEESDPYVRARLSCSASCADAAAAPVPVPTPLPVPVRVSEQGSTQARPGLDRPGLSAQPTGLGSGLCLVDYSSSDDEDAGPEGMEVSQASHQDTDEGNMRVTLTTTDPELDVSRGLTMKREQMKSVLFTAPAEHNPPDTMAQVRTAVCNHGRDRATQCLSEAASQFGQTMGPTHAAGGKTLTRALLCLSELRRVVAKLHAKNLFPYNPKSLLRLLVQVETVNLSQLAWPNKP